MSDTKFAQSTARKTILQLATDNPDPERLAEALLKTYSRKTPFPIANVVRLLGISVYLQKIPFSSLAGYFVYQHDTTIRKIASINAISSSGEQRYLIAIVLWHYLSTCVKNSKEISGRKTYTFYRSILGKRQHDRQAERFADSLLMPRKEFLAAYHEYHKVASEGDITTLLSRKFQVHATAVRRRKTKLLSGE